jgi:hypothetical protein
MLGSLLHAVGGMMPRRTVAYMLLIIMLCMTLPSRALRPLRSCSLTMMSLRGAHRTSSVARASAADQVKLLYGFLSVRGPRGGQRALHQVWL